MVQPMDAGPCAFWTGQTNPLRQPTQKKPLRAPVVVAPRRTQVQSSAQRTSRATTAVPVRWQQAKAALAVMTLLGAGGIVGARLWQQAQAALAPVVPVETVLQVRPGDSLWLLARRYGDPGLYILDRVDALARANRLPADAVLVPGQRVVVPVANPVEVAKLRRVVAAGEAQRQ